MTSNIGRVVYGYCNGFFGDSYRNKRIEAEGVDWIVARGLYEGSEPEFASFTDGWLTEKQALIDEWSQPEESDDD